VFELVSLLAQVPSPDYLLAMKLNDSRDERDLDDAAILFNLVGYTTASEAVSLLAVTYPSAPPPLHRRRRRSTRRNAPPTQPRRLTSGLSGDPSLLHSARS
jgi:hypothetical protein